MRRRIQLTGFDPYQRTIESLQRELREARETVIELMPQPVQQLLNGYYSCNTRESTSQWHQDVVEQIIDLAKPLPKAGTFDPDRANCPLCGGGTTSVYAPGGYSFPEGLRRHLTGWGRQQECKVMKSVMRLARECWDQRFEPGEEREAAELAVRTASRRNSETCYLVAPDLCPELVDERSLFRQVRDKSELAWAEQRLASLGFTVAKDSNVKSYTREHEDFVVYADPRLKGQIEFNVFRRPLPRPSQAPRLRLNHASFFLRDNWKHELKEKYESRLATAIADRRW